MFEWVDTLCESLDSLGFFGDVLAIAINIVVVAFFCLLAYWVIKLIFVAFSNSRSKVLSSIFGFASKRKLASTTSYFAMTIILTFFADRFPKVATAISSICVYLSIVLLMIVLSKALDVVNDFYMTKKVSKKRPLKGPLQVVKILIFVMFFIIIISMLIDQSPLILISGIGAFAAILAIVFKDPLQGLVASIQITSESLVRIGDWISIPSENIEGTVTDIALMTIRIKAYDNTVCTIPAYTLLTKSFNNWFEIDKDHKRQIKQRILIDVNSIKELNEKEFKSQLTKLDGLDDKDKSDSLLATNLTLYRLYISQKLKATESIREDCAVICRTVSSIESNGTGTPVEVICYTTKTDYATFCEISSQVNELMLTSAKLFDLKPYQRSV